MKQFIAVFLALLTTNLLADQFIRFGGGGGGSASGETIGDTVTGGTAGSILFVGAGPVLAQDNGNLFWDATNFRLGLGNATPAKTLDVTGTGKFSVGVIAPLIYPASNGTSAIQVDKADGTTVILNVDTTNRRLGIGSVTPDKQLVVDGGAGDTTTGFGAFVVRNDGSGFGPQIIYDPGAGGHKYLSGSSGASDATANAWFLYDNTAGQYRFVVDGNGNVGMGTTAPGAKLDVRGTSKLGTAGVAFAAAGGCTVASNTLSTTATNLTCTGVPASAAVAVHCSGQDAFTTPTASGLYCRATGTVDQIACNTVVANAVAMAYSCSWMQP